MSCLTRLFHANALHGSERTFRPFINAGRFHEVNVIVIDGGFTGKLMTHHPGLVDLVYAG